MECLCQAQAKTNTKQQNPFLSNFWLARKNKNAKIKFQAKRAEQQKDRLKKHREQK